MHLEIVTPDKIIFDGEVQSATFPGCDGSFQVLKNHAPMISALAKGKVVYVDFNGKHEVRILSGILEVHKNKVILLAEGLEPERKPSETV